MIRCCIGFDVFSAQRQAKHRQSLLSGSHTLQSRYRMLLASICCDNLPLSEIAKKMDDNNK